MTTNKAITQLANKIADKSGDGFTKTIPVPLGSLDLATNISLVADETNGRVAKVLFANDVVFYHSFVIPKDYDTESDAIKIRVLASTEAIGTDDDVELDMEVYVKVGGAALGSDLDPTAPGTVLTATPAWIEFDLSGNAFDYQDVLNIELITNGANDTATDEVMIHAVEIEYTTMLVANDELDR